MLTIKGISNNTQTQKRGTDCLGMIIMREEYNNEKNFKNERP